MHQLLGSHGAASSRAVGPLPAPQGWSRDPAPRGTAPEPPLAAVGWWARGHSPASPHGTDRQLGSSHTHCFIAHSRAGTGAKQPPWPSLGSCTHGRGLGAGTSRPCLHLRDLEGGGRREPAGGEGGGIRGCPATPAHPLRLPDSHLQGVVPAGREGQGQGGWALPPPHSPLGLRGFRFPVARQPRPGGSSRQGK